MLMIQRIARFLLAVTVAVGMSLQGLPAASAMAQMGGMRDAATTVSADQSEAAPDPSNTGPCKGMTLACMDTMACVVVLAAQLPVPVATGALLSSVIVVYSVRNAPIAGRSIAPELTPPIPQA